MLLVVVVSGGDDGPEIDVVRGAPAAGFPLRGGLAGDDGFVRDAARSRVDRDARRSENDRVFSSRRGTLEITALWAGAIGDDRVAVLAHDGFAALVSTIGERDGEPLWTVRSVRSIRDAQDPRIVPLGQAVLVAEDADARFRPAADDAQAPAPDDGLWRLGRSSADLPPGVLVLPRGLPRGTGSARDAPEPAAVVTGDSVVVRTLDAPLVERLLPDTDAFDAPAVQRFVAAASTTPRDEPTSRFDPPATVALVQDERLPVLGSTTVLTVSPRHGGRTATVAAAGGSTTDRRPEAQRIRLTADRSRTIDPLRGSSGPALGAAYVARRGATADDPDGPTHLLLAGDRRVRSFEVLAGARRTQADGPVAVVPAPWVRLEGGVHRQRDDVIVFGRTAGGAVVRPPAVDAVTRLQRR